MEDRTLDALIDRYKASALLQPPRNLNQKVWREIRLRQCSPVQSMLRNSDFLAWVCDRTVSLLAPTLALSIVVSIALTSLSIEPTQHQRVEEALGLKVFSHQSSPLTRLAQNP